MTDSLSAAVSRCLSHGGPFVWSWVGGQGWGTLGQQQGAGDGDFLVIITKLTIVLS